MTKPTGILLQSGRLYDYLSPETNIWTIDDIALGLSNMCRYAGQVKKPYSIAQHSVYVSYVVDQNYALDGLLHDAAEAFLTDIPTPLKALLPDYQKLEERHEAEIFKRFRLEYPMHPHVKVADMRMLKTEVMQLKTPSDHWKFLESVSATPIEIEVWSAKKARKTFLRRYYELITKQEY